MRCVFRLALVAAVALLGAAGCFYDVDRNRISDEDTSTDTDTDTDTETGSDGGADNGDGGGCPADDPPQGFGDACTKTGGECDGKESDFCFYDPMTAGNPGECTITDCSAGQCPDGYACCDCSGSSALDLIAPDLKVVACVPDENVDAMETQAGCSCQ